MSRKKVSLDNLPRWLQYTIAAVLMGAIAAAGYLVGRDEPTPAWIEQGLVPVLGWVALILIIIVAADWIRRRL
jgi:peptidoglycan/LPS O-acetylase OafA/YrhL